MMVRICGGGRREERGDWASVMIVVVEVLSSSSFLRLPLATAAVVVSLSAMVVDDWILQSTSIQWQCCGVVFDDDVVSKK